MKSAAIIFLLATISLVGFGQGADLFADNLNSTHFRRIPLPVLAEQNDENAMPKFGLSINPLGFVQFGPLINMEVGLTDNVILNMHARVSFLGILTYLINEHEDGLDELFGMAGGGGPIYFFGTSRNKPYAGVLLEFDHLRLLYAQGDQWEWEKTVNSVVFAMNGGYRFRFANGVFINTGAFLGAAIGRYKWEYSDISYGEYDNTSRDGLDVTPFGMLEVAFGIEF